VEPHAVGEGFDGVKRGGGAAGAAGCSATLVTASRPAHGERGAPRGQGMFVFHGFDALVAGRVRPAAIPHGEMAGRRGLDGLSRHSSIPQAPR